MRELRENLDALEYEINNSMRRRKELYKSADVEFGKWEKLPRNLRDMEANELTIEKALQVTKYKIEMALNEFKVFQFKNNL